MSFSRIVLLSSVRRLWFSLNCIRNVYTAQSDLSPLQIYRNKVEAYEVLFYNFCNIKTRK